MIMNNKTKKYCSVLLGTTFVSWGLLNINNKTMADDKSINTNTENIANCNDYKIKNAYSDPVKLKDKNEIKLVEPNTQSAMTHVNKDNFQDYFNINGSASYDRESGIITLTPDQESKSGNTTLNTKIDMSKSFELNGQLNIGSKSQKEYGADGIGIGFHPGATTEVGHNGGTLGIGSLPGAFGWKADTYYNVDSSQSDINSGNYFHKDPIKFDGNSNHEGQGDSFGSFMYNQNSQDGHIWTNSYDSIDAPAQAIDEPINNRFKDISVKYDGLTHLMTIYYDGKIWSKNISEWINSKALSFLISGSTGGKSNLQQFKIKNFNFQQAAFIDVKYVDMNGKTIGNASIDYPNGAYVDGEYQTKQLDIPNYKFVKMDDGSITGIKSIMPSGVLKNPGTNGNVIYVYAPEYVQSQKTINENINYVNEQGEKIHSSYKADPITFMTVTNPIDGSHSVYYANKYNNTKLDVTGKPIDFSWKKADSAIFSEVNNPNIEGYKVISNDAPKSGLNSVSSQSVSNESLDLDFTVVYAKNDKYKPNKPSKPNEPSEPNEQWKTNTSDKNKIINNSKKINVQKSNEKNDSKKITQNKINTKRYNVKLPQTGQNDMQFGILIRIMGFFGILSSLFVLIKLKRK